jgi:hypothetical protein
MKASHACLVIFAALLVGTAWAEGPGPVLGALEVSIPDRDVIAFHARRGDAEGRAIARKLVRDIREFQIGPVTPFHVRASYKTLEVFSRRENRGLVDLLAVRRVFLLDADDDGYGYSAGIASLALRRKSLEAG